MGANSDANAPQHKPQRFVEACNNDTLSTSLINKLDRNLSVLLEKS